MSAIFEDPGLAKIFAMVLLAIIGVLVIAVIILAFKKNQIIYVEKEVPVENPSTRPVQPKPEDNLDDFSLTADEIIPPVVSSTETEPVPMPDLPSMHEERKPLEETKTGITGISVSVTVGNNTVDTVVRDFPCLLGREASSCDIVISEPAVSITKSGPIPPVSFKTSSTVSVSFRREYRFQAKIYEYFPLFYVILCSFGETHFVADIRASHTPS